MTAKVIARLESSGVHWYCSEPAWLTANPGGSFDTNELARRAAEAGESVCLAVPGEDILLRALEVSPGERRFLRESLPYEFEESLAGDIENIHFVHADREEAVAVAIVSCSSMDHWVEQCATAEIGIGCWLPEQLLLPWEPDSLSVVVESDRVIVRSGADAGFVVERDLAATYLQLHCNEQEILPQKVYLIGTEEAESLAVVPDMLRGNVEFTAGDFFSACFQRKPDWHDLNLRTGSYMPRLPWGEWWQQWRTLAALLLVAFSVQIGSSYAELRALEAENLELRRNMETTYREVNPSGNLVDPERQLATQLAQLQGGSSGPGFVSLMSKVGEAVAARSGVVLESINFTQRSGDLRLNLRAPDYQAVDSLRADLEKSGLDAKLQNSSAQGTGVRARILVEGG